MSDKHESKKALKHKSMKTKEDESKKSLKQLDKLEQEAAENLAGWQRAKADYENLKKQSESERQEFVKYANGNLIMELLPIYDNFKLAFGSVPEENHNNPWMIGLQHIMKQMKDFLEANGVEEIKTDGEKFDPELHEAVESIADLEKEDGQIVRTIKSGYRLRDKIIQAAKVVVCENKK